MKRYWTADDLNALRERTIAGFSRTFGDSIEGVRQKVRFTCDECENPEECEWAFDPYNIHGDCIAMK
jgi:hypothetical protein